MAKNGGRIGGRILIVMAKRQGKSTREKTLP
jgi:hypothetical protein